MPAWCFISPVPELAQTAGSSMQQGGQENFHRSSSDTVYTHFAQCPHPCSLPQAQIRKPPVMEATFAERIVLFGKHLCKAATVCYISLKGCLYLHPCEYK
jgi:hypothetical protein